MKMLNCTDHKNIEFTKFATCCWLLVGCKLKANCLLMGSGPHMLSVVVFLRDPSSYLREFWRKLLKTLNG